MEGKTVVITGGTSGVGHAAAVELAGLGARIVLIARDAERAGSTLAELGKNVAHGVYYADLSLAAEVKRVAREIAAAEPRIDALINNAGGIFARRQVTAEGWERTFATNHVAYFALTGGLRERLLASAPARVINTASEVHRGARLDFDDLQSEKGYSNYGAYGKSKLCNILFTRELARRLAGTGVTANCLHPGVVATRLGQDRGPVEGDPFAANFLRGNGMTPEEGARTIVYLASSPEVSHVTGQYFDQCRAKAPSREAQDDKTGERLWAETLRIAGGGKEGQGA